MKNILVTGGTGYIGSHTVVELLNLNYNVVIIDNLSNSKKIVIDRIEKITGKRPKFYLGDIRNRDDLAKVFTENKIDCVINFAGLKAVGESVVKPLEYYENNIYGAVVLLEEMRKYNVFNFIFSSSATVYGDPASVPVDETFPTGGTTNPYGTTKLFIERILMDLAAADSRFNIAILRYFNPIGAHPSGLIGEDPNGIPNNLAPYITQVMVGKRECLNVFGNDYNTPDGTCIRDYIHVCDLAYGHVLTIKKLEEKPGVVIYNLGTGKGSSVFDVLHAFERAYGKPIPYKIVGRRAGDVTANYTIADKAEKEIGFKAKYDINDMARDAWHWQKNNPNGYEE
ncbi:MAG: UDP-glucose 4-epimerase GalE [Acholeplasmatales bacterium]|nr:UDP-glucose 4-epimerase GalE [Acholeplasmatales bacterium]